MRHYETRAVEQKVLSRTTCDLCGAVKWKDERWKEPPHWSKIDDVEIKHDIGDHFPGCQTGERLQLDICPTCFTDKVLPALRQLGLKRDYEPYD